MAVPTAYLTTTKNLDAILASIQKAGVPAKFTYAFLTQLGFPSSADRPIIPVLKALRFLDDAGVPLDRYRQYKDQSQAEAVLAEALREAYADLFGIKETANESALPELKGMFARLSDKGATVTDKMAMTFHTLAKKADFAADRVGSATRTASETETDETPAGSRDRTPTPELVIAEQSHASIAMHHDVHVHLPVSTEIEVYDAIFRSLRENLLT